MRASLVLMMWGCGVDPAVEDVSVAEAGLYGPENRWYHAPEDQVPASEGGFFAVGSISPELMLKDQYGDEFSSYQLAGKLIVVDVFDDPGEQFEEIVEAECPS